LENNAKNNNDLMNSNAQQYKEDGLPLGWHFYIFEEA